MLETASDNERPAGSGQRLRNVARLSWLAIVILSLVLLLIPVDLGANAENSLSGIMVLVSTFCTVWLLLTAGASALILAHADLFRRSSTLLSLVILYGVLMWLWVLLSQTDTQATPFFAHLRILAGSWLLILPLALGVAVGVHLWQRDNAISLAAITLLVLVWLLVLYARLYDAKQLLIAILSGSDAASISWFQPMICLTFWILILGPLSFLRHTLRLLYREWNAAR